MSVEPEEHRMNAILGRHGGPITVAYGVLAALYVLIRAGSSTYIADRVTDTVTYEQVAHLSLFGTGFYTGQRGFTIPLFYKLFTTSDSRMVAQMVISTIAWMLLAAAVAHSVRTRWLGPVVFGVVLGFSATTEVVLWDTLLLSESITFALTALLVAAWIMLVQHPGKGWAAAVLTLSLLWAFARDTNAEVLLVVGILVALTLVNPARRRLKVVLAVGCIVIFALDYGSAEAGKRWLQPFKDVVTYRVMSTDSLRAYFESHGLPAQAGPAQTAWIEHDGRRVYLEYLLGHPAYALGAPFHGRQATPASSPRSIAAMLEPEILTYNDNASRRFFPLPTFAEKILFLRGVPAVLAWIAATLALALLSALLAGGTTVELVPLAILVTTYPHYLLVWHTSGLEVDRHAMGAALLLRLSLFLLAAYSIDALLVKYPVHLESRSGALAAWRASDGRTRTTEAGAVLVVAAALVCGLVEFPSAFRELQSRSSANAALPAELRPLAGARGVDISSPFMLAARDLVPEGQTFVVVTGPHIQISTPITLTALPPFMQTWLLPRRAADEKTAQWLLCYGCDLSQWGKRLDVKYDDGTGAVIARIVR